VDAAVKHRPRWGSKSYLPPGMRVSHDTQSAFEKVANRLKLNRSQYAMSSELRTWVRLNYQHRYVPEDLLEAMGLEVL
jgi:hypothetical protein